MLYYPKIPLYFSITWITCKLVTLYLMAFCGHRARSLMCPTFYCLSRTTCRLCVVRHLLLPVLLMTCLVVSNIFLTLVYDKIFLLSCASYMIPLSSCSETLVSVLVVSFDWVHVYLISIPGSESDHHVSFDFSPYCRVLYFKYFCAYIYIFFLWPTSIVILRW